MTVVYRVFFFFVCVCVFFFLFVFFFFAAFQFSFGQVSRTGDEATDGSGTLDIAVPVVININPSSVLLSADTIITVSVSGGNATRRSMNIVCSA